VFAASLALASLLLLLTVVAQALALYNRGWTPNLGTIPEAVAAVGTVGALWVAVGGWQHEVSMRRAEDERRTEADRRAQAELVTTWHEDYSEKQAVTTIGLINASTGAVFDVEVDLEWETEYARIPEMKNRRDIPIGPFFARAYVAVLPPGRWQVRLRTPSTEIGLVPTRLDVYFRDQRGAGWARGSTRPPHSRRPSTDSCARDRRRARPRRRPWPLNPTRLHHGSAPIARTRIAPTRHPLLVQIGHGCTPSSLDVTLARKFGQVCPLLGGVEIGLLTGGVGNGAGRWTRHRDPPGTSPTRRPVQHADACRGLLLGTYSPSLSISVYRPQLSMSANQDSNVTTSRSSTSRR
jgi:hypothetical protein